jgi:hypothetical protein
MAANKYVINNERDADLAMCEDARNRLRKLSQEIERIAIDATDGELRESLKNAAAELEDQAVCLWFAQQDRERKPAA